MHFTCFVMYVCALPTHTCTRTMATAALKRGGARKAYDVTLKLKAVDFAEKESKLSRRK